ncbi:MAG: hypothetical protein DELT_03222 [Desulfovibrio sp.]|uniref:hypothetical protein n=1 Tax=Christensenella intestinihominis TaxID=1851429 RepID=UPI00082E9EC0|nr:hypothetical protein [Christensenella intestinihominis]
MNQFVFPYDSNIRYLPLVYFLPEDVFLKCLTLRKLPRDLSELSASAEKIESIKGDPFLKEIADAMAGLAFPHFGFRGWIEHYTGYTPAWQLAYALPLWAQGVEQETGWGVQALFRTLPHTAFPFPDAGYVKEVMRRVVKRAVEENGWQPILDVVKEMPCEEDFMRWDTKVRKDFLRKWYHTRSKRVKTVSLEACMEDEGHGVYQVRDKSAGFEDRIAGEDYIQRFKALLPQKDVKILELRMAGFTYGEIADRLGYKNHSGVIKRMQAIKKKFIQYENEQQ